MGNCITTNKRLKKLDADLEMLKTENRIRYEFLLREFTVVKQMLQSQNLEERRRFSCINPVLNTQNQIKYV